MCRKKPKPRQFFLCNDIVVYGNIVISKKKYNKQHIIPLENVKQVSVPDDGNLRNGWQIISPSKSFTVYAATATEKAEWMAHINKCIKDLVEKQGKKRAAVEDSPVWVPDSEATYCMHCKKSEFTVFNRRHHCRKCGAVVCSSCSNKRAKLPHQSSKPLRICLACSDKLSTAPGGNGAMPGMQANNDDSSGEESSDSEGEDLATSAESDRPTFYESPRQTAPVNDAY